MLSITVALVYAELVSISGMSTALPAPRVYRHGKPAKRRPVRRTVPVTPVIASLGEALRRKPHDALKLKLPPVGSHEGMTA